MPKSKSKKRKLAHTHPYNQPKQHNTKNDGNLSYEEIWDDSALVRSWNDAVAEYQFYHSIHARGEDVEEVLRRYHAENGDGEGEEGEVLDTEFADGDGDEEGEIVDDGEVDANHEGIERADEGLQPPESGSLISNESKIQMKDPAAQGSSTMQSANPTSSINLTNGILSVHNATTTAQPESEVQPQAQAQSQPNTESNQILENIKMAYYWAGYYSGLYDAQRQGEPQ